MHGDPPFSFWILTALGTSYESHMATNRKKTFLLGATVLNDTIGKLLLLLILDTQYLLIEQSWNCY